MRILLAAIFILLCAIPAQPQGSNIPNTVTINGSGAPSGGCFSNFLYVDTSGGNLYFCKLGTWTESGGGGGSFTAAGDLSGTSSSQTVIGINGTLLSGLATGLLRNVTSTGVPTIATAAQILAACTGCAPAAGPIAIASVGSSGLSGTSPVTISAAGAIACATCVTSAAALTNNAVVIGGGLQASATISADTTTTHALFATAGAPAFRALAAGDIPTAIPIANVGSAGLSATAPVAIASTGAITCTTCATGTNAAFTTTPTGLTVVGTATYTSHYTTIGNLVYFSITISGATSTTATFGTTTFTLPTTPARNGVGIAANYTNSVVYGGADITTAGTVFAPTWGATGNTIVISGTYEAN